MHPEILRELTNELWSQLSLTTTPAEPARRSAPGFVGTVMVDGPRRGALEVHLSERLARTAVAALHREEPTDDVALFDGVAELLGMVIAAARRRLPPRSRLSEPVVALASQVGTATGPHALHLRSEGELLVVAWRGPLAA